MIRDDIKDDIRNDIPILFTGTMTLVFIDVLHEWSLRDL